MAGQFVERDCLLHRAVPGRRLHGLRELHRHPVAQRPKLHRLLGRHRATLQLPRPRLQQRWVLSLFQHREHPGRGGQSTADSGDIGRSHNRSCAPERGVQRLASSDPDGTIATWAWSFGDGTSGSGPMITHVYSAAGFYVANVTVTDNGGASNTTSVTINVTTGASSVPTAPTNLAASSSTRAQDQPHVDQHGHQRDVDHRAALQRELVHGVCRRRPARRDGEVLDRHGGEVAIDVSLSRVRVQRRGEIAVLEHRERDGALSTSVVYASPCRSRGLSNACDESLRRDRDLRSNDHRVGDIRRVALAGGSESELNDLGYALLRMKSGPTEPRDPSKDQIRHRAIEFISHVMTNDSA